MSDYKNKVKKYDGCYEYEFIVDDRTYHFKIQKSGNQWKLGRMQMTCLIDICEAKSLKKAEIEIDKIIQMDINLAR